MTRMEIIAELCETVRTAIKAGDWRVDGACDPDAILSMSEARLEQEGWRKDGLTGEEWIKEA